MSLLVKTLRKDFESPGQYNTLIIAFVEHQKVCQFCRQYNLHHEPASYLGTKSCRQFELRQIRLSLSLMTSAQTVREQGCDNSDELATERHFPLHLPPSEN